MPNHPRMTLIILVSVIQVIQLFHYFHHESIPLNLLRVLLHFPNNPDESVRDQ